MTTVRIFRILRVITPLLLGGCAGTSQESDPMTRGQYCDATGDAFCQRAEACEIDEKASCLEEFKQSCCEADASCELQAKDAAQVKALQDKCVPALSALACEDVAAAVVPSACSSAP